MKINSKTFKCDCGDPQCGRIGIDDLHSMVDIYFLPKGKKKASCGVVLNKEHIKELIEFLSKIEMKINVGI